MVNWIIFFFNFDLYLFNLKSLKKNIVGVDLLIFFLQLLAHVYPKLAQSTALSNNFHLLLMLLDARAGFMVICDISFTNL